MEAYILDHLNYQGLILFGIFHFNFVYIPSPLNIIIVGLVVLILFLILIFSPFIILLVFCYVMLEIYVKKYINK